ncbi:hypothetical protein [Rhodovibrio salinarum]|uniref:Uncharacterized protein n=1 Tax=Rhodovibrio salinarum TaxID=1087 RepID=A0A934QFL8_9PROT|nr:hypothetical protein [Rhodovibrio salinarum]MBK1695747.1 hypothetical protein [Rhodovibrio salinarum]
MGQLIAIDFNAGKVVPQFAAHQDADPMTNFTPAEVDPQDAMVAPSNHPSHPVTAHSAYHRANVSNAIGTPAQTRHAMSTLLTGAADLEQATVRLRTDTQNLHAAVAKLKETRDDLIKLPTEMRALLAAAL